MSFLDVHNPHSVMAAIKHRPSGVKRIIQGPGKPSDAWEEVIELARSKKIPVAGKAGGKSEHVNDRGGRDKGGRVGGTYGELTERESTFLEDLIPEGLGANDKGLWLALDGIQDPQNLGSIFRSAAFFGVKGIIMPQDRSAALSSTTYDVSCGGVETVPFSIEVNMKRALETAKERGLWILGTSEHAKQSLTEIDSDRPWLLVLGNEEKGLRRLTEEACDLMCTIPCAGEVTSLNVSVAAGILISHLA